MGCADFLKEWFNSDAKEWVDENYQNISIDKILKVQFSIRLSALPYNCQVKIFHHPFQLRIVSRVSPKHQLKKATAKNLLRL